VFINIPIAKDHSGLGFTGTMKNMMGLTSTTTNMLFHHGPRESACRKRFFAKKNLFCQRDTLKIMDTGM
jgi:uncharacterized protein (DUF362 family)